MLDDDFPYPHLDPEDNPNWVEPEDDLLGNNSSDSEEVPF